MSECVNTVTEKIFSNAAKKEKKKLVNKIICKIQITDQNTNTTVSGDGI